MDKFICVRIVQANALDLSLFQFDYDLTFAAFFMNADRTIYGRYGSRSDAREAEREISLEGFAAAMRGALALHEAYPANKAALAGKQPKPVKITRPEEYASLKHYRPKLDYAGKVVESCMHCHQIRDAERQVLRSENKPLPSNEMYPYPLPDAVGMSLDPATAATVDNVERGSAAAASGFLTGDAITTLAGQPVLSMADVQWVLHHAKDADRIPAVVKRGERNMPLNLILPNGWRKNSSIQWRVSTWMLRRDNFGGMYPVDMTDEERRAAGLAQNVMALRLQHVGQYGEHAVAKRAGFVKDDIITSFDGQTKRMTETELHAYVMDKRRPGDKVAVTIRRGNRTMNLTLPLPKPN